MKTYNHLIESIAEYGNIDAAYRKARLARRYHPEVLEFTSNLEENLVRIKNELLYGTYQTGKYREFMVHDPKPRLIMALPFYDRVVHHAINNIIEPLFDRKFIYDSYGCRKGKGTIAGVLRLEKFIREATGRRKRVYVLKGDVKKYFYSVSHDVLKREIRRTIRCRKTLKILDHIIVSGGNDGRGMPIGNLTSQLFANIYLNPLDHIVKEDLQVRRYVRYMDDFVILAYSKDELWDLHGVIKSHLQARALDMNGKTSVFPLSRGIDFLGYRHFARYRLLRKRNVTKNRRKLKKLFARYRAGQIPFERIRDTVNSFIAHTKWACHYRSRQHVFHSLKF